MKNAAALPQIATAAPRRPATATTDDRNAAHAHARAPQDRDRREARSRSLCSRELAPKRCRTAQTVRATQRAAKDWLRRIRLNYVRKPTRHARSRLRTSDGARHHSTFFVDFTPTRLDSASFVRNEGGAQTVAGAVTRSMSACVKESLVAIASL